jgi:hypothetical protein
LPNCRSARERASRPKQVVVVAKMAIIPNIKLSHPCVHPVYVHAKVDRRCSDSSKFFEDGGGRSPYIITGA